MKVLVWIGKVVSLVFLGCLLPAFAEAQTASLQLGTTYQCPTGNTFKVLACAGTAGSDSCDVQVFLNGVQSAAKATRQQVLALLPVCHPQTSAEAQAAARGGSAGASAQVGEGGFRVGDTVRIDTAFGWIKAKILKVNGSSYYVHAESGADVWKSYPSELRRIGPVNAVDRAHGLYALGDRVQVNVEGHLETGEIITEMGQQYQVQLPNGRSAWASPQYLRLVSTAEQNKPVMPKAGTPPKAGFVSCARKIEGRYATSAAIGMFSITFRSGKATMSGGFGPDEQLECWTAGSKIILHKPGESFNQDMPIDINNDGTLDTPMGEIRKKGN